MNRLDRYIHIPELYNRLLLEVSPRRKYQYIVMFPVSTSIY